MAEYLEVLKIKAECARLKAYKISVEKVNFIITSVTKHIVTLDFVFNNIGYCHTSRIM